MRGGRRAGTTEVRHKPARGLGGHDALMGLDAETGVFMLLFFDLAHDEGRPRCRRPPPSLSSRADEREVAVDSVLGRGWVNAVSGTRGSCCA